MKRALAIFLLFIFSVAARGYLSVTDISLFLIFVSIQDEDLLQALTPNVRMDGVLRSLRSDPPMDVRTIGLLRSLRSDKDFPGEIHRDAMLRSLRSFPPAFLQGSRSKKSIQFLPIGGSGEKVLRRDVYGQPNFYEDLTLRYL